MDWITIVQTAIASSSIIAVALVILGFIAKSLFEQVLSKDIENHKIKLHSEIDLLKANLEKSSMEYQTRFESLHVKRAEVIAELYKLLVQTEKDVTIMMISVGAKNEPVFQGADKKALASRKELEDYFSKNRIYFTSALCEKISHFIEGLYKAYRDFEIAKNSVKQKRGIPPGALYATIKEIPAIKQEIENEFRKLIGIEIKV